MNITYFEVLESKMILKTYGPQLWGYNISTTFSDIEPGLDEYTFEVWERVTDGGVHID